jgi:hypothetical protein
LLDAAGKVGDGREKIGRGRVTFGYPKKETQSRIDFLTLDLRMNGEVRRRPTCKSYKATYLRR